MIKSEDELAACIECQSLSKLLFVREKFEAYAQSLKIASEHIQESKIEGYALVEVEANIGVVQITLFPSDQVADAELLFIDCEKRAVGSKGILIALVSSSAIGGIKEAYPNFLRIQAYSHYTLN
ncbi:hypothetical protein [Reinekea sp. G2M2-21]|uniref:hypothetical protein n=1 Tax=Reinekea sp. G2M2-21 TaxID=2788942 RepID=UPI0018AA5CC0|nr:hypothetical protein [Reinekea sp. G2M2-21]